jgi:general stress protein 26
MNTDSKAKFKDILNDFDVAMLVTQNLGGELRSRPMIIADRQDSGDILFIARDDSAKIMEMLENSQINVTMQSASRFMSISGTAAISYDKALIEKNWKPAWTVWFPKGQDDPDILLIQVAAQQGEYWDNSGLNAVQFWFEAGKAVLKGRPLESDNESLHGKVALNH